MTPVILLSDNYIANGSEPWRLPELERLPQFKARFRTEAEGFQPFMRDERLVRPWVKPGTPGLEHRIGGLEKEDVTGNVCYDALNHERMTMLRQAKVMGIRDTITTPRVNGPARGDLLVVGWGGTMGAIESASDRLRREGRSVANMHMRHMWPLPKGLDEMFGRYKAVLVAELNSGQLCRILCSEYPERNFLSYPKIQGKPFTSSDIVARIESILEQ
jgi:2-oxoglutarate ferredoxin oxidoreductase subunit alpha